MLSFSLLLAIGLLNSQAQVTFSEPLVYFERDDHDRPRCLVYPGKKQNLFFKWKGSDHYSREIYAKRSSRECSEWRNVADDFTGWELFPKNTTQFQGLEITDKLRERMHTIRSGGRDFMPSFWSANDYLGLNPIREFTREKNIELTQAYGHGFAGQIYREWLLSQSKNAQMRDHLVEELKTHLKLGNQKSIQHLKARASNTVLLVSMGLNWSDEVTEKTPDYVLSFLNSMKAIGGIETKILKRPALGLLHDNIRILKPQIEAELASGKDVILFGLCKGAPEMLSAASDILKPFMDENNAQNKTPAGRGKLLGSIHFSPMFSGIYWADFASRIPGLETLGEWLTHLHLIPSVKEFAEWVKPLKTMDTKTVETLKAQFVKSLPSDATYFTAVGIIPGDGLLGEQDTTAMNPFINANRKYNFAKGANDGFIEYPGLTLPDSISEKSYVIPMHGSHMLSDGGFESYSLKKQENKLSLYRAIIELILKR